MDYGIPGFDDAASSLHPAARTASADGATVDLTGYDAAEFAILAGAWTDGTHTVSFEESEDDSTWTAVASTDLQGTAPVIDGATDDDQTYNVGYRGLKRYVRGKVTVTDSPSTGAIIGITVLRGRKKYR